MDKTNVTKVTAKQAIEGFAKKRKSFTTGQLAEHYSISKGSATALIAIMRLMGVLDSLPKKPSDTSSRWAYKG